MIEHKQRKMIALLAPLGLVVGFGMVGSAVADSHMNPYLAGPAKSQVMNSSGECWVTVGGMEARSVACGDMMDDDGDGVMNDKDKCPDTPKGVKVDADGCPLDSDGDGVPDYMDKCPGTPAGAKVDAHGCEIAANVTINLVNDEFDFDSAALKPEMQAALDGFASKVMTSKGNESLSITGHTDSIGSEAYNQGLSERRAGAVAGYLAGKGIDAGMMRTQGAGESQPAADNGTREGRAKNRRVEIATH